MPNKKITTADLDLFGESVAKADKNTPAKLKTPSLVQPAAPSIEAIAAARQLSSSIYLGTSSWSFAGWAGLVYGKAYAESRLAKYGLAAYSTHPLFNSVSIDRTFYAPISEATFVEYADQVPPAFRFVVKAPMAITASYVRQHAGQGTRLGVGQNRAQFATSPFYLDPDYAINEFIAPATLGLKEKAGILVFQFPPQGSELDDGVDKFINRLYRFLDALPPGIRYAVEVRDKSLVTQTPRFFQCLAATDVLFCVAGHANMPSIESQITAMNEHLAPGDFICRHSLHQGFKYADAKSRYFPFNQLVDEDIQSRTAIADAIHAAARRGHKSFTTINNKAEGSAPLSVLKLAQALAALNNS